MSWNEIFDYKRGALICKKSGKAVGSLSNRGYLKTTVGGKSFQVHRIIFEMHNGTIPQGFKVDHIDRNQLNNNIENLRLATNSENSRNRKGCQKNNKTSGYRGVTWSKSCEKWMAQIGYNKKRIYLGVFDSKEDALGAVESKRLELFGAFRGE